MRKPRRLDAEAFEYQQVLERIREVILTADNVTDSEVGVVDARGEVVRRHAIRAQKGEVLHLVGELRLFPINCVAKTQRPDHAAIEAARHAIAQREWFTGSGA